MGESAMVAAVASPAKPLRKGKREAEVFSVSAKKQKVDAEEKVESDTSESESESEQNANGGGSKTLFVGHLSPDVQQADVEEFFKPTGEVVEVRLAMTKRDGSSRGFGHVEFATAEQAEKALRELNGKALLQRAVRLDLAPERKKKAESDFNHKAKKNKKKKERKKKKKAEKKCSEDKAPEAAKPSAKKAEEEHEDVDNDEPNKKTGEGKKEQSTGGCKTVFVGNLSFEATQKDVKEFFKPAGDVVEVRFATNREDDNKFRGFGFVQFATAKEAEKAVREMNGKALSQRAVRLNLADGTPVESGGAQGKNNSQKVGKDNSQKKGGPKQEVFVKGFDSSEGEHKIRAALIAHFSSCGEVGGISIPTGDDGKSKGFAYVQFRDDDSCVKALGLNGSKFGNGTLKVDGTKPKGKGNPELEVFVRGFDSAEGEHKIRSSLAAHFSSCGEVTRVSIPSNTKGIAYVQFLDGDSRDKALGLHGSNFGNGSLWVDGTNFNMGGDSNSGGGRGRGGGRSDFDGGRGGRGGRRGGRGFNNRSN